MHRTSQKVCAGNDKHVDKLYIAYIIANAASMRSTRSFGAVIRWLALPNHCATVDAVIMRSTRYLLSGRHGNYASMRYLVKPHFTWKLVTAVPCTVIKLKQTSLVAVNLNQTTLLVRMFLNAPTPFYLLCCVLIVLHNNTLWLMNQNNSKFQHWKL